MTDDVNSNDAGPDSSDLPSEGFVRLSAFVGKGKFIPISRSSWYALQRSGIAPKPKILGLRTCVYDVATIRRFASSLELKK